MLFALLDPIAADQVELEAGDRLFHRGDPADHMFAVRSGLIQVRRFTAAGRDVLMAQAGAGETLAEASLDCEEYGCSAIAARPSVVARVERRAVLERLRDDPEFAVALASALADQLRRERERIELWSARRARDRLLQHIAARSDDNGLLAVATTLKDLASELGLTHEALYRELAALERDGVIARAPGRIRLLVDAV
jgi:CRP-like cAMP-binding protein